MRMRLPFSRVMLSQIEDRSPIDTRMDRGESIVSYGPMAYGSDFKQRGPNSCGPIERDLNGLLSHGPQIGTGQSQQKKCPLCEHCCKNGHTKDTCWELHGKPLNWKSRQNYKNRGYHAIVDHQVGISRRAQL